MNNIKFIPLITAMLFTLGLHAQVAINQDNATPDPSAMLDVKSTDKGMLVPRMTTTQRTAINSPATGLLVFDNDTGSFWFYGGSGWTELAGNSGWSLTGNTGTDTTTHFIGTTDNMPLDFRVNNERALRISPAATSPSITAGFPVNFIANGVNGAVIAGGGTTLSQHNSVTADYGVVSGGIKNTASGFSSTVSGGSHNTASGLLSSTGGGFFNISSGITSTVGGGDNNTASGDYSTVAGGRYNQADGDYSLAAGRRAKINAAHDGAFLFADQNNFDFNSTTANEFAVRATGGVRFVTDIDASGNPTQTISMDNTGAVTATAFVGDGSGLTNVPGDNLGDHEATQNISLSGNYLSGDGSNEGVFVDDDGKVGVGNNTPTSTLDVNGDVRIRGGSPSAGARLISTDDLGNTEWEAVSDRMVKKIRTGLAQTSHDAGDDIWTVMQTPVMSLKTGDLIMMYGQINAQLDSGTGVDRYLYGIRVAFPNATGPPFSEPFDLLNFVPETDAAGHNERNALIYSYVWTSYCDCDAQFEFRVSNNGDDPYTLFTGILYAIKQ